MLIICYLILSMFCNLRRPGGDRIYGVFDNQLPAALRKLPFDRHLSLQNVKKIVSEADGYQPHLIAPEQGYRRLIEGSLNYFRGPAEASVDAVSSLCFTYFVYGSLTGKLLNIAGREFFECSQDFCRTSLTSLDF